jgi:hypothetical protein
MLGNASIVSDRVVPQEPVAKAKYLLEQGLFNRKVARVTGIPCDQVEKLADEVLLEMGITQERIANCRKLLAAGTPYKRISNLLGIRVGIVSKIANDHKQRRGQRLTSSAPFKPRTRLSNERIAEVQRLLSQGLLSHRQIAAQTGVSRGSINSIANGRLTLKDSPANYAVPADSGPQTGHRFALPGNEKFGQPFRCPDCGGMVYPGEQGECTLCVIRNSQHGPNSNVKLATADDCYDALHMLTFASSQMVETEEVVMDQEWTLTENGRRQPDYVPSPAEIEAATAEFRERHLQEKLNEPSVVG